MIRYHNKLVRDRIPDIIQSAGRQCAIAQMSTEEYQQALRDMLVEEAQQAEITNADG